MDDGAGTMMRERRIQCGGDPGKNNRAVARRSAGRQTWAKVMRWGLDHFRRIKFSSMLRLQNGDSNSLRRGKVKGRAGVR
jgi:hypothetical protein